MEYSSKITYTSVTDSLTTIGTTVTFTDENEEKTEQHIISYDDIDVRKDKQGEVQCIVTPRYWIQDEPMHIYLKDYPNDEKDTSSDSDSDTDTDGEASCLDDPEYMTNLTKKINDIKPSPQHRAGNRTMFDYNSGMWLLGSGPIYDNINDIWDAIDTQYEYKDFGVVYNVVFPRLEITGYENIGNCFPFHNPIPLVKLRNTDYSQALVLYLLAKFFGFTVDISVWQLLDETTYFNAILQTGDELFAVVLFKWHQQRNGTQCYCGPYYPPPTCGHRRTKFIFYMYNGQYMELDSNGKAWVLNYRPYPMNEKVTGYRLY